MEMFETGQLLKFSPFVFKNGAQPKDKYFIVLKNVDGSLLLATLPTSKDHVPSDMTVKHGCTEVPGRGINVFVFPAGLEVLPGFSFPLNTFIYGADLDTYPVVALQQQEAAGITNINIIGTLEQAIFAELVECLRNSALVKRKFKRML